MVITESNVLYILLYVDNETILFLAYTTFISFRIKNNLRKRRDLYIKIIIQYCNNELRNHLYLLKLYIARYYLHAATTKIIYVFRAEFDVLYSECTILNHVHSARSVQTK